MTGLLIDLFVGIVAILVVFFSLYRFTTLRGKGSAFVTALVTLAIYIPYAVVRWPDADVFSIHLAIYLVVIYILGIVASQSDSQFDADGERRWRLHWAPALIVGFFALVVSIDSLFLVVAQKGLGPEATRWVLPAPRYAESKAVHSFFPGTVPHDYQRNSEEYNAYLAQVRTQRERGWKLDNGWVVRPTVGKPALFRLTVQERDGAPVTGAHVTGTFMRPSNIAHDTAFTMQEVSAGVYQASLSLPAPGIWDLLLEVKRGEDRHELRGTTTVAPAAQS